MEELDEALDMGATIMLLALFLLLLLPNISKMRSDAYGGFDTTIEKTALKTDATLPDIPRNFHREDILLTMAVTDRYVPNPHVFTIDNDGNGTTDLTVNIDDNFLQNRIPSLINVYGLIGGTDYTYKLNTTPGTTSAGSKDWQFKKQ